MKFIQLLNSNVSLNCPVVIHNSSETRCLAWKSTDRISGQGIAKWRNLMECEIIQNKTAGVLEIPDANPSEIDSFLADVSGVHTDYTSKLLIARNGKPAACECIRCDEKGCFCRGIYQRLPIAIGGLSMCPLLFR